MTIHFGKEKWMKVAQWVLLLGCWLLMWELLGRSANHASRQALLELGPEKIFGTHYVIYQDAGDYLYTNLMAMVRLHFHCLSVRFGVTLLVAALATGLIWAYKALSKRKIWSRTLLILFCVAMVFAFICLAIICVWEWGVARLALLLCLRFLPRWSVKRVFTAMALIASIVILGFQRKDHEWVSRYFNSFWENTNVCTNIRDFTATYGTPVIVCKNLSSEDEKWFDELLHFDKSLLRDELMHYDKSTSLSGKSLYGFIPPNMQNILLLPIVDDNTGTCIILAWCDFTPERKELLDKKREEQTRDGRL